jgi:lipoate-protein ligase B
MSHSEVWVNTAKDHLEKIASIGVRISRGITMHGFALNVNVNLQPFALLSPCGIDHCVMTSMEKILDRQVNMAHVREQLAAHFAHVFKLEWAEQNAEKTKE